MAKSSSLISADMHRSLASLLLDFIPSNYTIPSFPQGFPTSAPTMFLSLLVIDVTPGTPLVSPFVVSFILKGLLFVVAATPPLTPPAARTVDDAFQVVVVSPHWTTTNPSFLAMIHPFLLFTSSFPVTYLVHMPA